MDDDNWPLTTTPPATLVEVFARNDGSGLYGFRWNKQLPNLDTFSFRDSLAGPGIVVREMALSHFNGMARIVLKQGDDLKELMLVEVDSRSGGWPPSRLHRL